MNPVKKTTNYAIFDRSEANRPVDTGHVRELMRAITAKNLLEDFPIVVRRKGDKWEVLDGQHRLRAAETLKLPVFYREATQMDQEDVARANSKQKIWKPTDYLQNMVDRGNDNYVKLKDFVRRHKIPLTIAVDLLSGKSTSFSGVTTGFREGKFVCKNEVHAESVGLAIAAFQTYGVTFANERSFVIAISRILLASKLEHDRLCKKLRIRAGTIVKCANWMQYVEAIDGLYNAHVSKKEIVSIREDVRKWIAGQEE